MRHLVSVFAAVRASRLLHRRAAHAVFRCPMAWFDAGLTIGLAPTLWGWPVWD
jgi:hypothetical protein